MAKQEAKPTKKEYTLKLGITDFDGKGHKAGSVVELTEKEAEHFKKTKAI